MKRVGAREQALLRTHRGRTAAVGGQECRHLCLRERLREVVTLPEFASQFPEPGQLPGILYPLRGEA